MVTDHIFKAPFWIWETKMVMYIITSKLNSTFRRIGKATGIKITARAVGKNSSSHFQLEWKFIVIEPPFPFLSFGPLYLGILRFKREQQLPHWISAYLIYRDHKAVCLFSLYFVKIFFEVLFSYCKTNQKKNRWPVIYHSWNTFDL